MRVLVAFFGLSLTISCSRSGVDVAPVAAAQRAIVGGADAATAGATVALFDSFFGTSFCSGTLVAPRVVVTAAHCLTDTELAGESVVVGALDVDAVDAELVEIASAVPHPQFGDPPTADADGLSESHDIGIVLLARDAPGITPAPILPEPQFDATLAPGAPVVVEGFGMDGAVSLFSTGTLRVATTPYRRRITTEFLAGGPGQPDTCSGDSGGPAYWIDDAGVRVLAGVTSRGTTAAANEFDCGAGGVFTIAGTYLAWLDEASGGQLSLPAPPGGGGDDVGDDPGEDAGDNDGAAPVDQDGEDTATDGLDDLIGDDGTEDDDLGGSNAGDDLTGEGEGEGEGDPGVIDDTGTGCSAAGTTPMMTSAVLLALSALRRRPRTTGGR